MRTTLMPQPAVVALLCQPTVSNLCSLPAAHRLCSVLQREASALRQAPPFSTRSHPAAQPNSSIAGDWVPTRSRVEGCCHLLFGTAVNAPLLAHPRTMDTTVALSSSQPHLGYGRGFLAPYATSSTTVVTFPLAQTGEGISECELLQWVVKEGDRVNEFDKLCDVQSDKATIEITSRYTGRILKLHHAAGDVVKVGGPLADIEVLAASFSVPGSESGSGSTSSGSDSDADSPLQTPASTSMPGGASEAASTQAAGPVLAAPAVRRVARELNVDLTQVQGMGPGGRISKEDVLRFVEQGTSAASQALDAQALAAQALASQASASLVLAAQAINSQALAEETVAAGRVEAAAAAASDDYMMRALAKESRAAGSDASPSEPKLIPIRGYARSMVKSMTAAAAIPHFHFMDEVAMAGLIKARDVLKATSGVDKLTFMPFIIKAVSAALTKHPLLNASIAADGSHLLVHPNHNIGVAMATPLGLVVPNIKQVESKSIQDVAAELTLLQQLAKVRKLSTEHLTGGTITVSNIGSIGGTYATPLVNPPEVAIVALGRVRRLPRYGQHNGQHNGRGSDGGASAAVVEETHVMNVSWGADHQVVDGASLAQFSNTWKQYMEEPLRLLAMLK